MRLAVGKPIRILIADDHTIVRSGVRLLLEAEPDIEVVGEALEGNQAIDLAASLQPDVILMDIAMPGMDGLEATRMIKTSFPEIQVLVLTMHRSDEYFFQILEAGASGYLLKGADTSDLVKAVRFVHRGEVFLYPTMAQKLLREFFNRTKPDSYHESQLSPREKEILRLVADGYSNKEIAEKLVISSSTVHSHLSNSMEKLGLKSRRELIQYARKHGLLTDY
jgi:two-component system, NarL family, response regulator NreC